MSRIRPVLRTIPVHSSLPGIKHTAMHQDMWPADYLVLSGALGKPCTSITIDRKVLSILHLTCVVLYLVLSSTVDQTVTTVLVQLGTGEVPELDL